MSRLANLLDRLRKIDWKRQGQPWLDTDKMKMHFHFDQTAELYRELHLVGPPFVAPHILLRLEPPLDEEILVEVAEWEKESSAVEIHLLWNAMEWAAFCDAGNAVALRRELLFEIPIGLIEERKTLFYRHGYFEMDGSAFPLVKLPGDFGLPSPKTSAVPSVPSPASTDQSEPKKGE